MKNDFDPPDASLSIAVEGVVGISETGQLTSAWGPLKNVGYRNLWVAWFVANICVWMGDVAAAWVMLGLSDKSLFVALVQTATTLPIVLLSLPFGAVADFVDRRRCFLLALLWMSAIAAMVFVTGESGILSVPLLLGLVFLNGAGQSVRVTVFSAMIPDIVSRQDLPQALALYSMAAHASRIIGPTIAGVLLASLGSTFVFLVVTPLSLVAAFVVWRGPYKECKRTLPDEGLARALWSGLSYVGKSVSLRSAVVSVFVVCLPVFALIAALPLLAQGMGDDKAKTYTLMFSCMGIGAIAVGFIMPRIRRLLNDRAIIILGSVAMSVLVVVVATAPNAWLASVATMLVGGIWLALGNVLTVSAQIALPSHMRARGMSIFMTAAFAGSASGAALFGMMADIVGIQISLLVISLLTLAATLLIRRFRID